MRCPFQVVGLSIGLSPVGRFVPFVATSRSCLPPFPLLSSHASFLSFGFATFVFFRSSLPPSVGFIPRKKKQTARCYCAGALTPFGTLARFGFASRIIFGSLLRHRSPSVALCMASLRLLLSFVVPPPRSRPRASLRFPARPLHYSKKKSKKLFYEVHAQRFFYFFCFRVRSLTPFHSKHHSKTFSSVNYASRFVVLLFFLQLFVYVIL